MEKITYKGLKFNTKTGLVRYGEIKTRVRPGTKQHVFLLILFAYKGKPVPNNVAIARVTQNPFRKSIGIAAPPEVYKLKLLAAKMRRKGIPIYGEKGRGYRLALDSMFGSAIMDL